MMRMPGLLLFCVLASLPACVTEAAENAITASVAATVFSEELQVADADELQDAILTRLFDRYAAERGLAAEEAEIDAFVENVKRGMAERGLTAEDELAPEEAAEVDAMRRQMGRAMIRQWKINKSLYETYGGRIIYQQLGPEPLDAYRHYLEERHAAGDFSIEDPSMAESFWRYFTDDSIHDFMESGSADEAHAFAMPPWERQSGVSRATAFRGRFFAFGENAPATLPALPCSPFGPYVPLRLIVS